MAVLAIQREQWRKEFLARAARAFDSVFDEDQQEQLITITQREDRILERGGELQSWLMEQHLQADPLANPAEADALRCPKCHRLGVRDLDEKESVPRLVVTRAGKHEIHRWKYRCPFCRTVFFPLGH